MMPFFRRNRGMALRPINRIKHVVDKQAVTIAGTIDNTILIDAKDAPVIANTNEVVTGSTVNGVYLKVEAVPTSSAALPNFYLLVAKNPGNAVSIPNPNAVGSSINKKFVIHQEMVMLQKQTNGNPRTIFNGVIAIPKHYRRFAPTDNLVLRVLSLGITTDYCVQCHYKEFR